VEPEEGGYSNSETITVYESITYCLKGGGKEAE
jgi:hypothetical protein